MSDKKTSVLKRCPFCGGEAEFHRTPIKTNGGWCDSVVVRCKECEARTGRVLFDAKKHTNDGEYEEVAKAWNTRKPIDRIVERLEEEIDFHVNLSNYEMNVGTIVEMEKHKMAVDVYSKAIEIVKEEGGLNE